MKYLILIVLLLSLPVKAIEQKPGAYLGAEMSEIPAWFKDSFLEFEEDVAEAAQHNKRVMIYFHQEGCPYCARLVEENFTLPEQQAYIKKHFDGVEINMWGDREIVSVGGKTFSEKTFAEALKVQYTPTIVFLDEKGKVALRLNGYYPPQQFQQALEFVAQKKERDLSFNEFLATRQPVQQGSLIAEDFFVANSDLKRLINSSDKPLALYFESPSCKECETIHQRVLTDPATRDLVEKMNNVQLNIHSDAPLTTLDGQRMTQRDYARQLNINYSPSVVFFDSEGREVHRIEGFLKTFHFQSSLAYVLDQAYHEYPSFQRYLSVRGEHLREQGFDTDIWGYESFHPAETEE